MRHTACIAFVVVGCLVLLLALSVGGAAADEFSKATPRGKAGCPAGTFLDIGRGDCWSCPKDYDRTVLAPVDSPQACRRSAAFSRAQRHARGTGLVRTDCPRGQFWDPIDGHCYSCPGGYNRTADPVTSPRACARAVKKVFARATRSRSAGCPAGAFLDIGRGDCWSCPAGWYRTVNPVTGAKACANNARAIFAADTTAICSQIVNALSEGEKGAARFMASVEPLIAPVMKPVDEGLRALSGRIGAPSELERVVHGLARGLRPYRNVVDEVQRLAKQVKQHARPLKALLLNPRTMCEGTIAERDRQLTALGLRPRLQPRASVVPDGLLVGLAHAAPRRPHVVVSGTVSFTLATSPPLPFNLALLVVTDYAGQGGVYFTAGPFLTVPPKTTVLGLSLATYLFPSADLEDFDGLGAMSTEIGLARGKPLTEFMKAAGVKGFPSGVNLSFDPQLKVAGYGVEYGVDWTMRERPRVADVTGSVDFSFRLPGR